jgi:phosphoribosylanthranilate isomerase
MRTKICGITRIEDALCALNNGAWALGFNFYKHSPRIITVEKAKSIIDALPKKVVTVGVFVEHNAEEIMRVMEKVGLDFAQVYHDHCVPAALKQIMLLTFRVNSEDALPPGSVFSQYAAIVLDAPHDTLYGGTGRVADWTLARYLSKKYTLILAGGLHMSNVREAVETVQPFAVDVASGVESSPGVKEHGVLVSFLQSCGLNKTHGDN